MIPGEVFPADKEIVLNEGRERMTLTVKNTGDRPVQIGSHFHFNAANSALIFDREKTRGYHLNIASGTAVRFEPGEEHEVELVRFGGKGLEVDEA